MRWLAVLLIWTAAVSATLLYVRGTHLGPTVAVVNSWSGIHIYDILFMVVAAAWAAVTSRAALRQRKRDR
jgi:hypothetical protein